MQCSPLLDDINFLFRSTRLFPMDAILSGSPTKLAYHHTESVPQYLVQVTELRTSACMGCVSQRPRILQRTPNDVLSFRSHELHGLRFESRRYGGRTRCLRVLIGNVSFGKNERVRCMHAHQRQWIRNTHALRYPGRIANFTLRAQC